MNQREKFKKLLDEYHSIKKKHDALFFQVTKKFVDIGANVSSYNPSDEELLEWMSLIKSIKEIITRMEELSKKNI